jgi:hypothetical protein
MPCGSGYRIPETTDRRRGPRRDPPAGADRSVHCPATTRALPYNSSTSYPLVRPHITYEELSRLPSDGHRYELFDGEAQRRLCGTRELSSNWRSRSRGALPEGRRSSLHRRTSSSPGRPLSSRTSSSFSPSTRASWGTSSAAFPTSWSRCSLPRSSAGAYSRWRELGGRRPKLGSRSLKLGKCCPSWGGGSLILGKSSPR